MKKNINNLLNELIYPKLDKHTKDNIEWHCMHDLKLLSFNITYCVMYGGYIKSDNALYQKYISNLNNLHKAVEQSVLIYCLFGESVCKLYHKYYGKSLTNCLQNAIEINRKWCNIALKKYDCNNLKTYFDLIYNEYNTLNNEIKDFETAFEGSSETTPSTLEYALVIASKMSTIQDEIYEELCRNDIYNIMEDIPKLDKLRAFVSEVLRCFTEYQVEYLDRLI